MQKLYDFDYMNIDTLCVHADSGMHNQYGGVSVPIYQTSTFAFENVAQGAARFSGIDDGYKYTRLGNPTAKALEDVVAMLEGGGKGLATSSGMAAISTVYMTFLGAGVHMVSSETVYGPSRTLAEKELERFGVQTTYVDTSNLEAVRKSIKQNTKLIFIETPGNPTLTITDIKECSKIAHEIGAILVVDNTFSSPILQKPLDLGADIVVHSLTKYINGHSDVVAGMIVTRSDELYNKLKRVLVQLGGTIDPHQAWLVLRGIKTLALRVRAAEENARKLAQDLSQHPAVSWVMYPGLPSHPQHKIAKKQMKGFGSMIAFELKGGLEAGKILLDSVKLCVLAVSLGGVETLIQHPASMTHASMSQEARKAAGISDGLVRLSVGIENYEDLKNDLFQALEKVMKKVDISKAQISNNIGV